MGRTLRLFLQTSGTDRLLVIETGTEEDTGSNGLLSGVHSSGVRMAWHWHGTREGLGIGFGFGGMCFEMA